jgi:UDP-3-O-[3-hydroxymyristoyl] glucosamine N-acyltransferase
MSLTTSQIAQHVGGELVGDANLVISGIAPAETAREGDLTFAEKETYFLAAEESAAAAILVSGISTAGKKTVIRVANARISMARLLPLFFPPETPSSGIDSSALIDPTAQVHPTAHIGPHCVIGPAVSVGARSALLGGNHIGRNCRIGEDVTLAPNVVLYARSQIGNRVIIHAGTVIGSDGYGYVFDQGKHQKVLQVGNVIINDDVEIGANAAIDRGALGSTVIGQGSKIDNLVHVAHNVVIGRNCLVMGQVGFAGSTRLGDYCVIASQSGIAGHLKLGNQSVVGAKSGVMRDIPDGVTVLGIPAAPDRQTKRQWIGIQQLPDISRRLRELEKELAQLKQQKSTDELEPS